MYLFCLLSLIHSDSSFTFSYSIYVCSSLLYIIIDWTVYVWHWHRSMNTTFVLEFEQNVVTRFLFDDQGKVLARGDLSEERLVQSQLGFSLTR